MLRHARDAYIAAPQLEGHELPYVACGSINAEAADVSLMLLRERAG